MLVLLWTGLMSEDLLLYVQTSREGKQLTYTIL